MFISLAPNSSKGGIRMRTGSGNTITGDETKKNFCVESHTPVRVYDLTESDNTFRHM